MATCQPCRRQAWARWLPIDPAPKILTLYIRLFSCNLQIVTALPLLDGEPVPVKFLSARPGRRPAPGFFLDSQ
jgi:hypothetical protein